jgi:hypothetical protein
LISIPGFSHLTVAIVVFLFTLEAMGRPAFGGGSINVAPALDTEPLEKSFQHKVLEMHSS